MLLTLDNKLLTILYPADYTEEDIAELIKKINVIVAGEEPEKILIINQKISLQLILFIFEKFNGVEIQVEKEPYEILTSKLTLLMQKYNKINLTLYQGN